ncbi:hypothetical protein CFC21_091338 [Triticum aestivum]|uniref:Uncharacterized protein n=3 Tax=Triticum TaxID=4564 RepID=A0A341XAM4_WHEAT|nr:hypothetical protein CFC21_067056 [Triticum aestivum]KAF7088203.1 hypothetical protein CFC21_091338 [Triticum aestivum]VAI20500.1 unnamed protein product [Triticum turgidum subsp. durum]
MEPLLGGDEINATHHDHRVVQAGEEDVSGGSGHVIEDVEGGTGGNGQMGFLGTEEKDAAATPTRTGFHFQPERTYER